MKIEILTSCSGYMFSFKQGDTVDVEDYIGKDLVGCGFAKEAVTTEKPAEAAKPESVSADTPAKKAPAKARKKAVSGNADA